MKYISKILFLILFSKINLSFGQDSISKSNQNNWNENIKLSGYFQFQYHYTNHTDSVRLHSMSAGSFDRFNNNKFTIRRSRFRLDYDNHSYAKAALSFDITEKGFIHKDAWLSLTETKYNAFHLNMGLFAMPFGHEIELQSMEREAPERSRIIQHLFPGIRDLGANVRFELPKEHKLSFLRLDGGIYHGTRGNIESDNSKDFNGRIQINNPLKNDFINFSLGYSHYRGNVMHQYDIDGNVSNYHYVFRMLDTTIMVDDKPRDVSIMFQDYLPNQLDSIIRDPNSSIARATYNTLIPRNYQAISGTINLNLKTKSFTLGKTKIRAEYIWGTQVSQEPTLADPYVFTSKSPTGPVQSVTWPKFDSPQPYNPAYVGLNVKPSHSFIRDFRGGYLCIDQQIGKTGHHLYYRYDFYNPNTQIAGEDINLNIENSEGVPVGSTGLSVADVTFRTHGIGYRYEATDKLSFTLFYEKPINEITNLQPLSSTQINNGKFPHTGYLTDIKDDIFTIRIQLIF